MSWMSVSWSEHFCQDDDGGGASPELPEVEDADAAGVAAMATAARLRRGEKKKGCRMDPQPVTASLPCAVTRHRVAEEIL